VGGNTTLSTNKIKKYTAYYEMYDNSKDWNYLGQHQVQFTDTDILMSPSIVGMADVTFRPFASTCRSLKSLYVSLSGKYVGKQYFDNTSSDERAVPSYLVAALSAGYEFPVRSGSMAFSLHVNNLFNKMYYADAWVWRVYFEQEDTCYDQIGLYPQAPANMMFKVAWRF
jgi:iron complex outermembrane receptor protein